MKTIIVGKIRTDKIDKNKLFVGKEGVKYLDITLIETESSKYGDDFMIVQQVSKEERLKGIKGPILGNAKYITPDRKDDPPDTDKPKEIDDDSVPF